MKISFKGSMSMKKQTKRPLLLSGLVMNIVTFVILIVSSAINIFYISKDLGDVVESSTIINLLINILLVLVGIVTIAFSAMCLLRTNMHEEQFHLKKGLLLTTFILTVFSFILTIVGMRTYGFDILTLFITLFLICSASFIIIEYFINKKAYLTSQEKAEENVEEK